jgi:hypothetical protein
MAELRPPPHHFSAHVYTFANVKDTLTGCEHIHEVTQLMNVKTFRERRRKTRCFVSGRLETPVIFLLQKALHVAYHSVSRIRGFGGGNKQIDPALAGNRTLISNLRSFTAGLSSLTDSL